MANDVKFIFVLGTLFVCTWLFLMLPRSDTATPAYEVLPASEKTETPGASRLPLGRDRMLNVDAHVLREHRGVLSQTRSHRTGLSARPDETSLPPAPRRDARMATQPTVPETQTQSARASDRAGYVSYKVRKGDTLCTISRKFFRTPDLYLRIFEANSEVLSDPDVLPEGVTLRIPNL